MDEKVLEMSEERSLRIPENFAKEFAKELRLVLRRDVAGIIIIHPEMISKLKPDTFKEVLNDYDLMLIPKAQVRK